MIILKIVLLDNWDIALDEEFGHIEVVLLYHAFYHFYAVFVFYFLPGLLSLFLSVLGKQIVIIVFTVSLQTLNLSEMDPLNSLHLHFPNMLDQMLDILIHFRMDKKIVIRSNKRELNLTSIAHVCFDFLLQALGKFQIFGQFLQDFNNLSSRIMQDHSRIQ